MFKRKKTNSLRFERLEARALLAASLECDHNALLPEDTNGSGDVTPVDALVVINQLARSARGSVVSSGTMADVNADGTATVRDAMVVINRLSRVRAGGSAASTVPIEARIERLAADIENNKLPANLDPATASAILAMLRTGKYPEVNESLSNNDSSSVVVAINAEDGTGADDSTIDNSSDDNSSDDSSSDDSSTDDSSTDDNSTDDSSTDDSSTDDSSTDDSSTDDSSTDDSSTDDNSTDDSSTDDSSTDDSSTDDSSTDDSSTDDSSSDDCLEDSSDRLAELTAMLTARYEAAGVEAALIPELIQDLLDTVGAQSLGLGLGLGLIGETGYRPQHGGHGHGHGDNHGQSDDPAELIEQLSDILLANGNKPEAVQTLADELAAAIDAGDPLTKREILARIDDLELTLPASSVRIPTTSTTTSTSSSRFAGSSGQRFNPRDAFFASLATQN